MENNNNKETLIKYYINVLKNIGLENESARFNINLLKDSKEIINKNIKNIQNVKQAASNEIEGKFVVEKEQKNFTFQDKKDLYLKKDFNLNEFLKWFQSQL